jgi:predicted DNA-binding transcriptional regulator AlpA
MAKRFIRFKEACQIFSVGRSTLYHRIKTDPRFPKPVKILGPGTKSSGFIDTEINNYIAEQLRARDGGGGIALNSIQLLAGGKEKARRALQGETGKDEKR